MKHAADIASDDSKLTKPGYWLTRYVILRLLGIVYAVAFLVAINEIVPLIGADGLTPVNSFISDLSGYFGSTGAAFRRLPSIFWWFHSDQALLVVSWAGFAMSLIVIAGYANIPLMTLLWLLYMSIVHIGQEWYGYGWEIQLLETGFLAIFLCPLFDMQPFPKRPPPFLIIMLFRWLIFRIMLGSGLIKWRGDTIWRDATALYYHFETQPIPGPLSRWFHFLPRGILRAGVWFNFLAELIAPLFVFWPRIGRHIAGIVIIVFQVSIILSGNLSFLNWLTIVPALACLDDGFWSRILPGRLVRKAQSAADIASETRGMKITTGIITGIIVILSFQPAINLLSPGQVMNTSYDPLDLVNTYGAFGTVGKERYNVVFEGTMDALPDSSADWKPYPYRGLPVALDKRPPQVAPYQLRLDWQMWFASMSSPYDYPWTWNLIWKLLHNDPQVTGLFAGNPFPDHPPRYIRAVLYRYQFASPSNASGLWWKREQLGLWIQPLSADSKALRNYLKGQGWLK